jgi:hypothetical protein
MFISLRPGFVVAILRSSLGLTPPPFGDTLVIA